MDFKLMWHNCSLSHVDVPFETFRSGGPKFKVTLEGQIFVQTITHTILDGFQYKFAQSFSVMSRCAIWNICRSKVRGQRSRSSKLDMSLDNCLVFRNYFCDIFYQLALVLSHETPFKHLFQLIWAQNVQTELFWSCMPFVTFCYVCDQKPTP